MSNKLLGYCRLCGEYGDLTFEHIPPKRAFNNQERVFHTLEDRLQGRGRSKFRRGLGKHSLCERCNNRTGDWYGPAYAEWARQGFEWLDYLGEGASIQIPFQIMPLNVLKQIATMLLAMTHEGSIPYHEELRRFALNKQQKYLSPIYNIYAYLTSSGPRFEGGSGIFNFNTGAFDYVDAEIALPPFGYCLTSTRRRRGPSLASQQGLCHIDFFAQFDYNIWTTVFLRPPLVHVRSPFPLDYRSEEEIMAQASESSRHDQIPNS